MALIRRKLIILLVIIGGVLLNGCSRRVVNNSNPIVAAPDACRLAFASHQGSDSIDLEITRLQAEAQSPALQNQAIERLGWVFVQKARLSYDPGYYKLAEACASCLQTKQQHAYEALLLRGHILNSLHRFKEAEALARELAEKRGLPFDYGLLGDALMEQGQLDNAVDAYQRMVDLKPGPQSYSRAAHIRWLKGNLTGAIELMGMAASASSTADRESAAWAYTRLANYELQAGSVEQATRSCKAALAFQPDYAPALLTSGRMLLAANHNEEAIDVLTNAVKENPLPEYQWTLADALRTSGRIEEAIRVEDELRRGGAANDPRTFALFLATRRQQPEKALELAERELDARQDVFTFDALAWSLAAAGRNSEARSKIKQALAEGTRDARLFYHAGVIAVMNGEPNEARLWLGKASSVKQTLLPCEREEMSKQLSALGMR